MTQSNTTSLLTTADGPPVEVLNPAGTAPLLLICEHASPAIPLALGDLGLDPSHRMSHAAWDPGAFDVAMGLSDLLGAPLVAARFSRLAFDCNRAPDDHTAMPGQSERITVPGNASLSAQDKTRRSAEIYEPFHTAITEQLARMNAPAVITIHSFTPVYNGQTRDVELGILFDPRDDRFARAMLATPSVPFYVKANAPYGSEDGVFHTLERHALPATRLNAMVEIRNDLLTSEDARTAMINTLHAMITSAMIRFSHMRGVR